MVGHGVAGASPLEDDAGQEVVVVHGDRSVVVDDERRAGGRDLLQAVDLIAWTHRRHPRHHNYRHTTDRLQTDTDYRQTHTTDRHTDYRQTDTDYTDAPHRARWRRGRPTAWPGSSWLRPTGCCSTPPSAGSSSEEETTGFSHMTNG